MTEATPHPDPVGAIALLDEPKRRSLYELVTSRREPMGRDEAASALGIGRELAAFHLDRLAEAGLLEVEYRRLTGRTGPGAGRPAKLYRRAPGEVTVSFPARDYERVAETFAEALDRLDTPDVRRTVDEVAHAHGIEAGTEARARIGRGKSRARRREGLVEALGEAGYEPTTLAGTGSIRLQNCPYHALSASHRELTCGMNLAWAEGMLEGMGDSALTAQLDQQPGWCCVVFRGEDETEAEGAA